VFRRLRSSACALILALGAGCITPSIPIPPPEPTAMTFDTDPDLGQAVFTYEPRERFANAIVYIFNQDQGTGIITTARPNGGVGPTEPFPGVAGDQVLVTFEIDEDAASTCVVLRAGTPNQQCE
jgi:hypothetical protein